MDPRKRTRRTVLAATAVLGAGCLESSTDGSDETDASGDSGGDGTDGSIGDGGGATDGGGPETTDAGDGRDDGGANDGATPADVDADVSSEEYLTGDGSTDDAGAFAEMVEAVAADGGGAIELTVPEQAYRFENTAAPETDGEPVTIASAGQVTIDGTGVGHILDFSGAGNVTLLGPLTIEGDHGDGIAYSVRAGDDFTFRNLTLEGGQGGLDCGFSNVQGSNVTVRDHHYPEKGWSAAIHGGGSTNGVDIEGVYAERCDRGIEFENGATDVTVTDGELVEIDNSRADDPGSVFVLDVHSHPDMPLTENITYEGFTIRDCARGLSLQGRHEDGHARNLTARDVTIYDSGDGPPNPAVIVRDAQDVLIEDLVLDTEHDSGVYQGTERLFGVGSRTEGEAVQTELTARNVEIRASAKWDAIYPRGARMTFEGVTVHNPAGDTGKAINVGSGQSVRNLAVSDLAVEDGGYAAAVEIGDDALQADPEYEWGAIFRQCDLEAGLIVAGSNAPILVEGSSEEGHDISGDTEVVFR